MKFLFSSADKWNTQETNLVRLNLLGQVGSLESEESSGPLLQGSVTDGSGLLGGDTKELQEERRRNITLQSSEAVVRESVGGSYWSTMLNTDRFKGYVGLQAKLLDPAFWVGTFFAGKEVVLSQLKAGMKEIGSPSKLFGNTPHLRGKHFQSLVSEEALSSILNNLHIGKPFMGRTSKISLSSLEFLEEILQSRLQQVNAIQDEQFQDFTAKIESEVWWKRLARKPLFQTGLYRAKFKRIKYLNQLAHQELIDEIKSLKQEKEQQVFEARQVLDARIQAAQSTGETEDLNKIRKTVHAVLNSPDKFIENKGVIAGFDTEDVFGKSFVPIDVLEALRDVKYEQLKAKGNAATGVENFLDSAVGVNNVKVSHYNSLRVLEGLQNRVRSLDKFDGTSLRALEKIVALKYERSAPGEVTDDPKSLVDQIISALGSATPGLLVSMYKVIGDSADPYSDSTELFWYLAKFLGENTHQFEKLPPNLQSKIAGFLKIKRDKLEQPLVVGGVDETSTMYFQARALKFGGRVVKAGEDALNSLSGITERLKKNESQDDLGRLSDFVSGFETFYSEMKDRTNDLPDFEKNAIGNVLKLKDTADKVKRIHESLKKQQEDYAKLHVSEIQLKTAEDRVKHVHELFQKYSEVKTKGKNEKDSFTKEIRRDSALGGILPSTFYGGDYESAEETLQKELDKSQEGLQDLLTKKSNAEAFMFDDIPSNLSTSLSVLIEGAVAPIKNALHRMGLDEDPDLTKLLPEVKFDELARMELGQIVTKDVLNTGNKLLQNDAVQQFRNLKKARYTELSQIFYAESSYQKTLTTAHLACPSRLDNLLFARVDGDGSLWYHNQTQVVRITAPKLNSTDDQRNMAIWYKSPEEKGYGHFAVSHTQPDALGIYLTANPENAAAVDNELYGKKLETKVLGIQGEIQRVLNRAA